MKKYLINKLEKYANDIIPIDRSNVVDFFIKRNSNYRKDYIDFISRYGGNNSVFFKKIGMDCSFATIKDLYLCDDNCIEKTLPDDCCHFSENNLADNYCINNTNGSIYEDDFDDYENPCCGELVYGDISDVIAHGLMISYLKKISLNTYIKVYERIELDKFIINNEKFKLDIRGRDFLYFLDKNRIDIICLSGNSIRTHFLFSNII